MKTLMKPLRSQHFAPKYVELAHVLLRDIASRGLQPGDRLGTETELVSQHSLSRATVRQALLMLERDGYVSRHRAKGTFVNRAVDVAVEPLAIRGSVLIVCSNELTAHLDEDMATTTVLRAIERTLARKGFIVQMLGVGENAAEDVPRLQRMGAQSDLEGICTIGPCLEPYRYVLENIPLATSCTFNPLASPWVGQDVREVSRSCVKYLLDRGHRDIAMVCSADLNPREVGVFVKGYQEAFAEADLPFRRQLFYQAFENESLTDLVRDILSADRRPTAVFAENWRVCQATLAAAASLGINIPDDVSLVAFGQNALAVAGSVLVTCYVPDGDSIGVELANVLTAVIDGGSPPPHPIFVPGRIVERDSVKTLTS
jgi:DNA-binding LacI/PurR family transcriptional regulator